MKKNKTELKIAALTTGLLAAAVGTGLTLIKVFTDMAIDKDIPKVANNAKSKVNGAIIGDDAYQKGKELSRALRTREHLKVHITNRSGLSLAGHVYEAKKQKRIVIAMHGWRSTWSFDFGGSADFFLDEGCTLILTEQRSHGTSEGEAIGFGVLERYDCLDWINYAKEKYPNTPIYLLGISMGATTVLMTSGLELPSEVKGVIADCGFTSPHAIWSHVIKKNTKISGELAYPVANYFINKKAGYSGDEASTIDAVQNAKVPILFVHGDEDNFVPMSMTMENYNACKAPKMLLIVKGASHGMSYFVDTPAYQQHVRELFKND